MLELVNVHAHYGRVHILQGCSLNVGNGEAVGLLGRNGVGKTTTLKTIMGLVPTTSGNVSFNGTNLNQISAYKISREGVGYVPQGRGIFPTLTVKENLEIGLSKGAKPEILEYIFERFPKLKERLDQSGGTLSGGEQQMLAIARCLVLKPKLLILDEPTEGIMPILVQDIRREIAAVNQEGVSILLVEQNIKTALKLCSRIYLMEKGVVVHEARAEDLEKNKDTLHRYLGVSV